MKIAVLATGILKDDMKQKCSNSDTSIIWADSIEDLSECKNAEAYFDLDFSNEQKRIEKLGKLLPAPVFINSVVYTLTKINQSFIRINAWPGFLKNAVSEIAVHDKAQKENAERIFEKSRWNYLFVPDIAGMVSARILAMIINEAYYTLQEGVSTKQEIDIAMKLGTNYPFGPFEWSEKIGLHNIYDLLTELKKTDKRYRISKLLEKETRKNR